jgi:hypothetical protein
MQASPKLVTSRKSDGGRLQRRNSMADSPLRIHEVFGNFDQLMIRTTNYLEEISR